MSKKRAPKTRRSPLGRTAPRPYEQYSDLAIWKVLDRGINRLVRNQDLVETSSRTHIVGYLVKLLVESEACFAESKKKTIRKRTDARKPARLNLR